MGKRTIPALPQNAIVIDVLVVDHSSSEAELTLDAMLNHFGEERFNEAMDHLYQMFVYDVLTNEGSPLHGVFREAMHRLQEMTMSHLHRSHERIELLEAEHKDMKSKLAELTGRVRVLESALGSVRRCLKSDPAKGAIQFCQRLRKQNPAGETAEAALALSECVKDACGCIKDL